MNWSEVKTWEQAGAFVDFQSAKIASLKQEQKRAAAAFSELDAFLDDCDFPKSKIFRLNELIKAVTDNLPSLEAK